MQNEKEKMQMLVVLALIRDRKGKIFLQKRHDSLIPSAHNKWEFPGGKVNYGERPDKAVVRECYEETGFKIKALRLLPYIASNVWNRNDGKEHHALVLCYEARLVKKIPRHLHRKVSEAKWFPEKEIKKLNTLAGTSEFIKLFKY